MTVITPSNKDDLHAKFSIVMAYVEKTLSTFNIVYIYPFAHHILFAERFKTSAHHLLHAFDQRKKIARAVQACG
jgi:hypothetical protein